MISFNSLGNHGKLGNQMYQYATLRGVASKHGYDYCTPPRENFCTYYWMAENESVIYDVFKNTTSKISEVTSLPNIEESDINFDNNIFESCPDNVNLHGYFQSHKYFTHIEDEIRDVFTFDTDVTESVNKYLREIKTSDSIISLHIRRGDYLSYPDVHPTCSREYYDRALEYIYQKSSEDSQVIVFTDDVEWAKSHEFFNKFIISEGHTDVFDMCLMTQCDYHIIANSSFSWWGAWLSHSKGVVAPRNWFGPRLSNHKIEDRIPGHWRLL